MHSNIELLPTDILRLILAEDAFIVCKFMKLSKKAYSRVRDGELLRFAFDIPVGTNEISSYIKAGGYVIFITGKCNSVAIRPGSEILHIETSRPLILLADRYDTHIVCGNVDLSRLDDLLLSKDNNHENVGAYEAGTVLNIGALRAILERRTNCVAVDRDYAEKETKWRVARWLEDNSLVNRRAILSVLCADKLETSPLLVQLRNGTLTSYGLQKLVKSVEIVHFT